MNDVKTSYCFLTVGTTKDTESSTGFKRYVGLGNSYILAVNPDKKLSDELLGFESANEPEYVKDTEDGKEVHINFLLSDWMTLVITFGPMWKTSRLARNC